MKDVLHKTKKTESYEEKRDPFKHFDNDMYLDLVKLKEKELKIPSDLQELQDNTEPVPDFTNFDPSGRTTSHSYRHRDDVAKYLKNVDNEEVEENGDFVKAKGVSRFAWESSNK